MYRSFIFIVLLVIVRLLQAQQVETHIQPDRAYFTAGKDTILNYQIAEKSLHGTYARSNYIHPLYSLDGQVLTEDFPADHLHHRGIFWAWHQLYVGDKRIGDGWEIKDVHWEVASVTALEDQGNARAIQAEVFWKSGQWLDENGHEKALVKEHTTIKVYPAEELYRAIDIEISLLALEPDMRIGGSEDEKGYGGFSPRIRLPNELKFTGPDGTVTPENTPVKAGGWIDMSGALGKNGALSGVSILCHPQNPGTADYWILRSQKSMQNAVYPYPGATAVPLSQTNPTVLRYRLLVHEGDDKALDIKEIYTQYVQENEAPFTVEPLFDADQPATLGLSFAHGLETFTIFSPGKEDNKYNHGVVLFPFKDMLYAQWQSSANDEDAPDTQVFYSRSPNGKDWERPIALTEKWENGIKTSGGWWSDGDSLVAYICVWPIQDNGVKSGYTEFICSTDGIHWNLPRPVKDTNGQPVTGIIEQDLHTLPGGRLLTAFHMQPGLKATPYYTDDSLGVSAWTAGTMTNLPSDGKMSREIEPSWFYRSDSAVVMIFRDQQSSFKKLASISHDKGITWSIPVIVDTPDSRAKQSAGNLPDGTAFMVNNPSGNKNRIPLVITLSKDGFLFDKAFLLRSGKEDLQAMRFEGKYKRAGYSYPKSVIWNDYIYVSYATNKEDVELSRVPVASLLYGQ